MCGAFERTAGNAHRRRAGLVVVDQHMHGRGAVALGQRVEHEVLQPHPRMKQLRLMPRKVDAPWDRSPDLSELIFHIPIPLNIGKCLAQHLVTPCRGKSPSDRPPRETSQGAAASKFARIIPVSASPAGSIRTPPSSTGARNREADLSPLIRPRRHSGSRPGPLPWPLPPPGRARGDNTPSEWPPYPAPRRTTASHPDRSAAREAR